MPTRGEISQDQFIVPLTLIDKDSVSSYDFESDNGRRLSLLTSRERAVFGMGVLLTYMLEITGPELVTARPEVLNELLDIAGLRPERAEAALECMLRKAAAPAADPLLWKGLGQSEGFLKVGRSLAKRSLMLVEVAQESTQRRSITFSFDEQALWGFRGLLKPRSSPAWQTCKRAMGWTPRWHSIPTPSLGHGQSYHLRIPAPKGLKATSHRMSVRRHSDVELKPEDLRLMWRVQDTLHLIVRKEASGTFGLAQVAWRPRLRFPAAAWVTALVALFTLIVLGFNLGRLLDQGEDISQIAASVLLLFPAGVATAIARDQDPIERIATLPIRGILVLVGLCSYLGALVLAVGQTNALYETVWWLSTCATFLCLVALTGSLLATFFLDQSVGAWLSATPPPAHEGISGDF